MIARLALAMLLAASATTAAPFSTLPVQSKNTKKASFVSKVMSKARRLDEDEDEAEIDLTSYSIKYVKCQMVKAYNDEDAEDADTVMKVNRFIVFRLCPSSSCIYNYGEYLVDMDTYLEAAVEYQQEQQEEYCNYCDEVCAADDDEEEEEEDEGDDERRRLRTVRRKLEQSVDCDTCANECEAIENMEDNGYVEASNYIVCQQVGEDDDGTGYYAGAMCANSGANIKIGVFLDEDCSTPDNSLSVATYVGATLSNSLMKNVYDADSSVPCVKPNWEVPEENDDAAEGDDAAEEEEEEVEVNEMCQNLYEASAKCESKHGFQDGVSNYEDYANQYAQEDLVCSFMNTLSSGAYDESGEIILTSKSTNIEGATEATGGQKFALTVFVLGTVGLAGYAAQLHMKLTGGSTSGISNQGGAMA